MSCNSAWLLAQTFLHIFCSIQFWMRVRHFITQDFWSTVPVRTETIQPNSRAHKAKLQLRQCPGFDVWSKQNLISGVFRQAFRPRRAAGQRMSTALKSLPQPCGSSYPHNICYVFRPWWGLHKRDRFLALLSLSCFFPVSRKKSASWLGQHKTPLSLPFRGQHGHLFKSVALRILTNGSKISRCLMWMNNIYDDHSKANCKKMSHLTQFVSHIQSLQH